MKDLFERSHEQVVVHFAGGGGSCTGFEWAIGRSPDHAVNHNLAAMGMHRSNHPMTRHHIEDVFEVSPEDIKKNGPIGAAWFSPDCKHFSKAKGGKPLDKRIRGLVLVMLRWAKAGTRVMFMENVEEITTWGPLVEMVRGGEPGWYPDPQHKGRTWQAFLACMSTGIDPEHADLPFILEVMAGTVTKEECVRGFGYDYQARELRACDYGTPTIRKRLFAVFRNDRKPIVWPEATHGDPATFAVGDKRAPWRTIAECIDWARPCPSIFLTGKAAKQARCKRPLAPPTLRRIAMGIKRYVLEAKEPFLVCLTHQGGDRNEATSQPANTITGAHRGEKALVVPALSKFHGSHKGRADGSTRNHPVSDPLLSQDTSNRFGLSEAKLAPFITEHANASTQRNMPAGEPMRTQCGGVKGGHFAAVAASMVNLHGTNQVGSPAEAPLCTASAGGQHHGLITGTLVHTAHGEYDSKGKKRGRGARDVHESMPTSTASPDCALVTGTLVQTGYGERKGQEPRALDPQAPLGTVVAGGGKHAVVSASLLACHLTKFVTGSVGDDLRKPGPTITAGSHAEDTHGGAASTQGLVSAYLAQHNGGFNTTEGHDAREPISTISGTGSQQQVVAASMAAYYGSEQDGQGVDEPARTGRTKGHLGLVESAAVQPLTADQVEGARRVTKFLRDHGVQFDGEFAMVAGCVIVDIGMRMLTPRELFRAQGFPESYIIDRATFYDPATGASFERALTKEEQIRMCGNSVCPPVAEAIVRANVPELEVTPCTRWTVREEGRRAA